MIQWNPGRLVKLQHVCVEYVDYYAQEVRDVSLRLDVYPNGDSDENRGYVSFFITNLGDVDLMLDFELQIKLSTYVGNEEPILAGDKTGVLGFSLFSHNILLGPGTWPEFENSDEDLEIKFTINNVLKEGDDSDDSSESKTESLREDYTKLTEKCDSLAKKIEKIESEVKKEKKLPTRENFDIIVKRIEKIEKEITKEKVKIETDEKAEKKE